MRGRNVKPSRFQYRDVAGSLFRQANLYKIPVNSDGSFGPTIKQPNITYTQELHNAVLAKLDDVGVVLIDNA